MKPAEFLNELSNKKLGDYKTAAGADATAADKAGDYKRGDKRMSGIIKATKKEFANDKKKKVAEAGMPFRGVGGAFNRGDDERHDLDPTEWYIVKDGKMYKTSVYPNQVQQAIAQGYSRTRDEATARATRQGMAEDLDENLNKWFKEKWVRFGPDGKIRGDCARGDDSEGKPKCLPQSKAQNLGKKGRASAAARKRREDPNPERSGKAINVNTKKKSNEGVAEEQLDELSCWSGYHRVAGTKAGFPGSCAKNKTNEEGVAEGSLNEYRDRLLQYVKNLLPTWPEYVLKDWLVPNKGDFSNLPDTELKNGIMEKLKGAGLTSNSKWQLVPDMKFTMDMFDPKTKQLLAGRAGGTSDLGMGIPKDKERHATQAALAQQQGGVRKEPVLLIKTAKGYELLEGWHRTIQHFVKYPDGYTGPAYVAVAQGQQGVAEGGAETSWSNDTGTITLQDILELTKHIKQINLPINDNLKSKLLHWEGNPEEIERVNQVTVSNQFPILIMVDEQGQIAWILDGNHRLHKAIQSQAKTIPAKLIKPSNLNDKAKKIFNIKEQGVAEAQHSESCPHCGGEMVSEELMNEKKDACYYKVKSRYKVWPSAYASGALVKCRKSGADSWGNGGKKNESIEEGLDEAVGGNYLYYSRETADEAKQILSSGYILGNTTGKQPASDAQTTLPTVSFGRNIGYQISGANVDRDYQVVFVFDRTSIETRYKTLGTSQSQTVRGLANPIDTEWGRKVDKLGKVWGLDANADGKVDYKEIGNASKSTAPNMVKQGVSTQLNAPKAGGEFEEIVPTKTGKIPLQGLLVGFYLVPGKAASKDPELLNDPRRLDMPRPNQFVKAKQEQGVAEEQLDEKWTKKYKDSINCSNPKGFSQKAHCAGKQKNESAIMKGLK